MSFEPKLVGFLCNWCSYAGADLAGVSRLQYGPNVRIVRVPCSGRVDPLFVARSLKEGADGVLVLGCHPGDCHYSDGNYYTRRRFAVMRELPAGKYEVTGSTAESPYQPCAAALL